MKKMIIFASMAIAAGLTLTNMYTSLVDVPSWGSDIPNSIQAARAYFRVSDPSNFFRVFSPLNQLLGFICILLFWRRSAKVRWFLVSAFLLYVLGEGMTFEFFYPRNDIMFHSNINDVELLKSTWIEWRNMNWVRTAVVAAGFICSSVALHSSYAFVIEAKTKNSFSRSKKAVAVA